MGKRDDEKPEEIQVRRLMTKVFGCELTRIPTADTPRADYETSDETSVFEIKRVTSQEYLRLAAAFRGVGPFDSTVLTGRWHVMIERPDLSSVLKPIPKFAADDPAQIADLEAAGFTVRRRSERIADHRANHPMKPPPGVNLRNIAGDIEPYLAVFEQHGIESTVGLSIYGQDSPLLQASRAYWQRTNGAIAMRHDFQGRLPPGIEIGLSTPSTRTERPDTIVERIDLFLQDEGASKNLKVSLANHPGREHHAVLVFDPETEPEYLAAVAQGVGFCPTMALDLPAEIDAVWFLLGPVLCRYDAEVGWQALAVPEDEDGS